MSLAQDLQLEKIEAFSFVNRKVTAGWELLSISTISSGLPFTIYSGVQQTAAGSGGVDRPNQIGTPNLSTARKVREDYFGLGTANASYFSIPQAASARWAETLFAGRILRFRLLPH